MQISMNVMRYPVIRYAATLQEVISVVATVGTHWMVLSVLVSVGGWMYSDNYYDLLSWCYQSVCYANL